VSTANVQQRGQVPVLIADDDACLLTADDEPKFEKVVFWR
jgi:hypothetical protein